MLLILYNVDNWELTSIKNIILINGAENYVSRSSPQLVPFLCIGLYLTKTTSTKLPDGKVYGRFIHPLFHSSIHTFTHSSYSRKFLRNHVQGIVVK